MCRLTALRTAADYRVPYPNTRGERNMKSALIGFVAVAMLLGASCAYADVVTDANEKAAEIASKLPGTPPAVRTMAIVQVSVFEAVSSITGRYPPFRVTVTAAPGA